MLGDFMYYNPTRLYFGEHALDGLREELPKYGKNIQLSYGGGSVKKNGIYDLQSGSSINDSACICGRLGS